MIALLLAEWRTPLDFAWTLLECDDFGRDESGHLDPIVVAVCMTCGYTLDEALDVLFGLVPVSVITAARIASVLGVSLEELLQPDFLLHGQGW